MPKFNIAQFEEGDSLSDSPVEEQPSVSFQRGNVVPNKFPLLDGYPNRIAIVGEAPGKDEEIQGQPFVGMSGKLLTNILNRVGLVREGLFIGNICQYRPPNNKVEYWYKYGTTLQEGLEQVLPCAMLSVWPLGRGAAGCAELSPRKWSCWSTRHKRNKCV